MLAKPTIYRCRSCRYTVIITIEAQVTCVKCARLMKPLKQAPASARVTIEA